MKRAPKRDPGYKRFAPEPDIAIDNRIATAMVALTFLVLGWFGGMVVKSMPGGFLENFRLASVNRYHAVAGYDGDPKVYYVLTDHRDELEMALNTDTEVIRIQSSFMPTLLIVTLQSHNHDAFNRIRSNDLVNSITSLPFFCH